MINLNLIPQEQKNRLKNERFYSAFKEAAMLLFLFVAITSIMLILSRFYLENQLADLMQQNAAKISFNENNNRRVALINSKILAVENIQNNFIPTRALLEKIITNTPSDIAYNSVIFFRQQSTIELSGTSKNRDSLLAFKALLQKINWVKSVDLPMASLINKENNSFIIKLEVDLNKISL